MLKRCIETYEFGDGLIIRIRRSVNCRKKIRGESAGRVGWVERALLFDFQTKQSTAKF